MESFEFLILSVNLDSVIIGLAAEEVYSYKEVTKPILHFKSHTKTFMILEIKKKEEYKHCRT